MTEQQTEEQKVVQYEVHEMALQFPAQKPNEKAQLRDSMIQRVLQGLDPLEFPILLVGGKIADAYAQSLVRSAFGAGDASAFTWERGVALVSNPEVQRLATAGRGLARLGGYVALATAAIEILELRHPWVCYWTHTGP